MYSIEISQESPVYNGLHIPKSDHGSIVGYRALTEYYNLSIPRPRRLSIVSSKNRKVTTAEYQLYPSIYRPAEDLFSQLTFALKYEGINLLVLKKTFEEIDMGLVKTYISSNSGIYVRRIWYLYEWLLDAKLDIKDAKKQINYALLADPKVQFTTTNKELQTRSERHRITNNLLGTLGYCPQVYVTAKIRDYQVLKLETEHKQFGSKLNSSMLRRASAYLLLKDSKASFAIEGENPKSTRLSGWAEAIGQAGGHPLTKAELLRLQQLVLPSKTKQKIHMGYREKGGFIGEFDQETNEPRPEHLSAKAEDLEVLMSGLIETNRRLIIDEIDAVVAAAIVAFGFVFIHPFVDGNGRIHRYLIHHILAAKKYTPEGVIFPVSASIEKHIPQYAKALKAYSRPLLDYIEWKTTADKNVKVTNESIDFYRYYDATHLVEYLYECITETIELIIPYELDMLRKFDEFKLLIEDEIGLPDNRIKLLANLLLQNQGILSTTKYDKFFNEISDEEKTKIEECFKQVYNEI